MQEYELKVLEQYPIDVKSTRKARGAFFCETDTGLLLLKEARAFRKKVPALCSLYTHLQEQGVGLVDKFLPNKEGEYVSILEDETPYVLKKWFQGKECDIRRNKEVMDGAKNLARLHQCMRVKIEEYIPQGTHVKEEYLSHNRELKKVRKFIRGQTKKGEFELMFLNHFDELYWWAEKALCSLEESRYEMLYKESLEQNHLTHGEYNYHNILSTEEGIATTNFDRCKRNVQAEDVYYYLRKVMEKHSWNVRLCDCILNAYCAVCPLSKSEMDYIKIRLLYPEKFWKITDSYYRSNKAWMSVKNVEKLKMIIAQMEEKKNLMNKIF